MRGIIEFIQLTAHLAISVFCMLGIYKTLIIEFDFEKGVIFILAIIANEIVYMSNKLELLTKDK